MGISYARKIYAAELERIKMSNNHSESALINSLADAISAKYHYKTSQDITLSYFAETPDISLQRLAKYIAFVQQKQLKIKNAGLLSIWENKIKTLTPKYE